MFRPTDAFVPDLSRGIAVLPNKKASPGASARRGSPQATGGDWIGYEQTPFRIWMSHRISTFVLAVVFADNATPSTPFNCACATVTLDVS